MKTKVYIDGQSGTTGLQIYDRIGARDDIELMRIDEDKRHDKDERRKFLNSADLVFLCLPDDGAREAVSLIDSPDVRVIDASTAHRVAPGWTYGFPELNRSQRNAIRASRRVANPGCHATGFISTVSPLVQEGILPPDYPVVCYSLTGYSGGGKKMIAQYEADGRDENLSTPGLYGLSLHHKHLPEMQKYTGLIYPPAFLPVVDDYRQGMASTVLLQNRLLSGHPSPEDICGLYQRFYENDPLISVRPFGETGKTIYAGTYAGTSKLEILVYGQDDMTGVTALFDNLGKGASGAAVQNMNIMLGLPETTGLLEKETQTGRF
ncbi:MAG: N-acetyl-gamma-glutamyl-phosphate reductase [Lachnospiraceae bacterium]|nr:N-acetyl-gamma-glutamyl-phosphate reductase [Lachnospiraceae bacterium]